MSGRSTPQASQQRNNRNLSQIRHTQINGVKSNDKVLASLRATQVVASKPVLPAELLALILDYLPVPDLVHFAQVSRRLQEMVYDDTRWIQKLKTIGVWNEAEARQRVEDAMKRKAEAQRTKEVEEARRTGVNLPGSVNGIAGGGRQPTVNVTLFDAGAEEAKHRQSLDNQPAHTPKRRTTLVDGFDDITSSPSSPSQATTKPWDPSIALHVLSRARSIRGRARQEFGRIYGALGPLHMNLARSKNHSDAVIFKTYRDPEQQAQILSSLKQFAQFDSALGWQEREQKLDSMIGVFENAVLREFEQGLAANDVDGRMHRYAHVLVTLNGGSAGLDTFIAKNPLMARNSQVDNPLACLQDVASGHVDLNPSRQMFEWLAVMMVEQAAIVDRVFPPSTDVLTPLLSRLCDDVIADYLTTLFDEAHGKGIETYVKAVSGTFEQALRFLASLKPTKASPADFAKKAKAMVTGCYEKHIDLYLTEELAVFTSKSDASVTHWEKELSDQEASTESFFMSNISRQAAKRDFLSSFKKVVMMPVNVLPAFSAAKPAAVKSSANLEALDTSYSGGRPRSPSLNTGSNTPQRPGTPQGEAPTTELAAKAAIMNSRLEGIKSLFSVEVALDLTHLAKGCIERAAIMVRMGGTYDDEAKEQCEAIFVTLLDVLGDRHIRTGFDKAIGHLGTYNPREVRQLRSKGSANGGTTVTGTSGVEPLVTFLELVNVGDLIQQMIDVFYAQELVATKLTNRDDFLDPAVKEKKRFEQMLDERVAAGLNRGIDVLMDEVEYICATTQLPTDFNPGAGPNGTLHMVDIGASETAKQIVAMISGHTGMLTGTTDKNMLDVFVQEVGLRLFGALCKHFKRQRISVDGAIKLISDINLYSDFISTLKQKPLNPYFHALREMSQIYLVVVDPPAGYFAANAKNMSLLSTKRSKTAAQAKELATIIADSGRYQGILGAEEVYEFAERRADWLLIKGDVERAMYGVGCVVM